MSFQFFGCCFRRAASKANFSIDNLSSVKLTPPRTPSYTVNLSESKQNFGSCETKVYFLPNNYHKRDSPYPWISYTSYQIMNYDKKGNIIVIHIQNKSCDNSKNKSKNKLTMIYCHKKEEDLGMCLGQLLDLCSITKNDIIAFDYTGYGSSQGSPKEECLKTDIEIVINFAIITLGIKKKHLYLLGTEIGAISAIHICTNKDHASSILGLILIAPELTPESCSKLAEINCPVFIIHGMNDEIIPQNYIVSLGKTIQSFWNWYPSKGTHYNLFELYRRKLYTKIRIFIQALEAGNSELINEVYLKSGSGSNKKVKNLREVHLIKGYAKDKNERGNELTQSPSVHMYIEEDFSSPKYTGASRDNSLVKKTPSEFQKGTIEEEEDENYYLKPETLDIKYNLDA